jgi:hypothetical protein
VPVEICNQGFVNDRPTDDPTVPGAGDMTCFEVASSVIEIPTLGAPALAVLALLLAFLGVRILRRHRRL